MNNKVFFLGAGFSKALTSKCTKEYRYPSLKELTSKILEDFSKNSLAVHISEIAPGYKYNIEELLTYLCVEQPWQNPQIRHLDKALYFELVGKIAKYFYQLDLNANYNFEEYNPFANFIISNKIPTITLNYDLLLEQLFSKYLDIQEDSFRNFYQQAIVNLDSRVPKTSLSRFTYGEPNRKNLPVIHKLHGSINWLWSAVNSSDLIYCASGKEEDYKKLKKDLSEYIIPPVLDKTSFYNHNILKSIWSDAYSVLSSADEVYIIGFSFPITDLSVNFLFNSAFANINKKRTIYVINTAEAIKPQSENFLKNRYKAIFNSCNININYDYCCDDSLKKFMNEKCGIKAETKSCNYCVK